MKVYNVCWSGGIDSTFIITQLSRFPVTIRPFYIRGQTFRQSEPQEMAAIEAIRKLLLSDFRTKAELLPLSVIEKDDSRVKAREIIKAHRRIYIRLLEKYKTKHGGSLPPAGSQQIYADGAFISPQYVACASLAKYLGEKIEIGLLRDDFEENMPVFRSCSTAIASDEITGRNLLYLCDDDLDKDLYVLFKDLRFPIAGQRMYKRDVWQWYAEHEYLQVRSKTNFCQAPVIHADGTWEPCGICTACIGVIHENLLDPFTDDGLARYHDYEENHEKEPERFRLKGF